MTDTPLSLSHLKQLARQRKRGGDLSHCQALDAVARAQGYPHWKALLNAAAARTAAAATTASVPPMSVPVPVKPLPIPSKHTRIFHRVAIEGVIFSGYMAVDGPSIVAEKPSAGGVNLGPMTEIMDRGAGLGWWIVKYDAHQPRINLNALSEGGRHVLSHEFGIPFADTRRSDRTLLEGIYACPAFAGLPGWISRHPRIAMTAALQSTYVPDWYPQAMIVAARISP